MGDELIIICNGPTLNDVDPSWLKSMPSFGANGIFMLEDFEPSVYFATDGSFITNKVSEISDLATRTPTYIRRPWNDMISGSKPFCKVIDHVWSYSPITWVGSGGTVAFVMLQWAFASDAKTVYIVGLDHDYFRTATAPEHFHKDYLKGLPHRFDRLDDEGILEYWSTQKTICDSGYKLANNIFKKGNKKIINLTPGSQCDIFEMGEL